MMLNLPVQSAHYNHAAGHLLLRLPSRPNLLGQTISCITADESICTTISARPDKHPGKPASQGQVASGLQAHFKRIWLNRLDKEILIVSHQQGTPAVWRYRPDQHEVRHWDQKGLQTAHLSLLLSFPRSGSNFVQNVLKQNCPDLLCAGIYRGGHMSAPHICLKSHAIDSKAVAHEVQKFWSAAPAPNTQIALLRDPRDMFLSIYDYVAGHRQTPTDPDKALDLDFFWFFFPPHVLQHLRQGQHAHAFTVANAYASWLQAWVFSKPDHTLLVRYEDLVQTPEHSFAALFDHIGQTPPTSLKALRRLVSQNGSSARQRGAAQSWKQAPARYQPLIRAVEARFGDQIAQLGYD